MSLIDSRWGQDYFNRWDQQQRERDQELLAQRPDDLMDPDYYDWRLPRLTVEDIGSLAEYDLKEHPGYETLQKGWLPRVLDVLDLPRNLIAQGVAKVIGMDTDALDFDTIAGKKVYTSDILSKGLGMDDNWVTKALGFIGDVALDPLTYLGPQKHLLKLAPWIGKIKPEAIKELQMGVSELITTGKTSSRFAPIFAKSWETFSQKASGMSDEAIEVIRKRIANGTADMMIDPNIEKTIIGQMTKDVKDRMGRYVLLTDETGEAARSFAREFGDFGYGVAGIPFTEMEARWLPSWGKRRALNDALLSGDTEKYIQLAGMAMSEWKDYGELGKLWGKITNAVTSPMSYIETVMRKGIDPNWTRRMDFVRETISPWEQTRQNLMAKHGLSSEEANKLIISAKEKNLALYAGDDAEQHLTNLAIRKAEKAFPALKDLPDEVKKNIDYETLMRKAQEEGALDIAPYFKTDPGFPTRITLDEDQLKGINKALKIIDDAKVLVGEQEELFAKDMALSILDQYPDVAKDPEFVKMIEDMTREYTKMGKYDLSAGVLSSMLEDGYSARTLTKEASEQLKLKNERNPASRMAGTGNPTEIGAAQERRTRVMRYIDDNGKPRIKYNPDEETTKMLRESFGAEEYQLSTLEANRLSEAGKFDDLFGEWKGKMFLEDPFLSHAKRQWESDVGHASNTMLYDIADHCGARYIRSKKGTTEIGLLREQHKHYNRHLREAITPLLNDAEREALDNGETTLKTLLKSIHGDPARSAMLDPLVEKSVINGYKSELATRIGKHGTIEGRMKNIFDEQVKENLMRRGVTNDETWKQFASRDIDFDTLIAGKEKEAVAAIQDAKAATRAIAKGEGMFKGNKLVQALDKQGTPPEGWAIPKIFAENPYYKNFAIPEAAAKEVNSVFDRVDNREAVESFLSYYDSALNFWKSQALLGVSWPVFNIFGGMFFNFVNGVSPSAYRPDRIQYVTSMLLKANNVDALKKMPAIQTDTGIIYTADEIMKMLKDQSIVNSRFVDEVSGLIDNPATRKWALGETKEIPQDIIKYKAAIRQLPKFPQTSAEAGRSGILGSIVSKPMKSFFRFNELLDEHTKATAFIDRLRVGDSPNEAARFVAKIQPDYHPSRYTKFEKDYAMRLFPFYKWSKNATYTMLTQVMAKRPWGMALMPKLQNLLQVENGLPRELFPEWMRDEMAVQVGGDKDSGMLLTLGNMTPHQDFFNLFDPVRSGISMSTPYLKAPIEFSLDRDLFTGRKISDYPGDNALNKIGNIIEKNIRPWKEIKKYRELMSSGKPSAYVFTRLVAGGRAQYLDVDAIRKDVERDTNNKMQEIRRALNDPNVDPKIKPKLAREFMELMAQRARMSLSVPRSAEIILRQWNNDGTMPLPWVNRG
jgi:hypothetical protein